MTITQLSSAGTLTGRSPDDVRRPPGDAGPGPLLSVRDLRIEVAGGRIEAVHGVSFDLGRGESLGLVGESGSGKTLTCRALLGVLPPGARVSEGVIDFDGHDLTRLPRRDWDSVRGRRIGAVFQDPASYLDPSLTVGHQLREQLRVKLGRSRREARNEAIDLLAAMGLHRPEVVAGQHPHELSGGMVQRVLIALAVAGDPDLLVADEATTALDVTVQAEVLGLLRRLRQERGLSVLAVSHDLAAIAQVCDRVMVFYAGELVESGTTAQVLTAPRHPYTAALLRVASAADWRRRELEIIPGAPPALGETTEGCSFAPRCSLVQDRCRSAPIPLTGGVRCTRVNELTARRTDPVATS